jgi:hypothetical protein
MSLRGLLDPGDWLAMKPQLNPEATPVEFHYRPEPFEVRARLVVGVLVAGLASVAGFFLRDDGVALFVVGGFALFGLFNAVYGVLQSRFSMSVTITGLEVAVKRNSLWGASNWRESLRSYQGILLREEEVEDQGSGKIRRTKRYSIVELLHSEPSKTLPLYVREGGDPPWEIQQAFARRFRLPELAQDITGTVSPATLRRAPDPGPPPPGVIVQETGGITYLAIEQSTAGRLAPWIFWPLLLAAMGGLVYLIDPEMALAAAGMAAGLAFVLLLVGLLSGRGKNRMQFGIFISNQAVWLGIVGEPPQMTVPFDAIRQVRVDRAWGRASGARSGSIRLVVDGGDQRLEFARGRFDRRKLEWIRNRVLYQVSRFR